MSCLTAQSNNLLVSLVPANIFLHSFKQEHRKETFLCHERKTWHEAQVLLLWLSHKRFRLLCYSDEKPSMHIHCFSWQAGKDREAYLDDCVRQLQGRVHRCASQGKKLKISGF